MQTKLLNAAGVARELVRLFSEHSKINIAVAWAVMNEPVKILLSNKRKFESVLIGTDFAATDWRVIKKLVNVDNAYVAGASSGCFHPKIYYFETEDLAEAIVGSANLTPGGLGANHEACLLLSGMKSEKIFCDLRRQLGRYSHLRREITPELAKSYELQAKTAAARPRPPRPQLPGDGKSWKQMNSPLVFMEWREFVRAAGPILARRRWIILGIGSCRMEGDSRRHRRFGKTACRIRESRMGLVRLYGRRRCFRRQDRFARPRSG
jgi:HKD family nuclease